MHDYMHMHMHMYMHMHMCMCMCMCMCMYDLTWSLVSRSARVASLVPPAAGAAVAGASPGPSTPATAVEQETAAAAYEVLRGIHEKKGWAPPDKHG